MSEADSHPAPALGRAPVLDGEAHVLKTQSAAELHGGLTQARKDAIVQHMQHRQRVRRQPAPDHQHVDGIRQARRRLCPPRLTPLQGVQNRREGWRGDEAAPHQPLYVLPLGPHLAPDVIEAVLHHMQRQRLYMSCIYLYIQIHTSTYMRMPSSITCRDIYAVLHHLLLLGRTRASVGRRERGPHGATHDVPHGLVRVAVEE